MKKSVEKNAAGLPGRFLHLSMGDVYYEYSAGSTVPVIFIGGIIKPSYVFDKVYCKFKESGRSVLRYDNWGRGFSAKPKTVYNAELFVRQLEELTDALSLKKFHLAGLSMGALIAAAFAVKHPEKVQSLMFIAPAGYPRSQSFAGFILSLPVIGDLIWAAAGRHILLSRNLKNVYESRLVDDLQSAFMQQMKYPGYFRAVLSTMRSMDFEMTSVFKQLAKSQIACALMWGDKDAVISPDRHKYFLSDFKNIKVHFIRAAGHECIVEKPGECAEIMLDFFN